MAAGIGFEIPQNSRKSRIGFGSAGRLRDLVREFIRPERPKNPAIPQLGLRCPISRRIRTPAGFGIEVPQNSRKSRNAGVMHEQQQ